MAWDHSLKSQTLASSSDPNEDQVTTNECDHAELVESKDSAELGMNTSTNKQVCLSRSRDMEKPDVVCAINYLWLSDS